MHHHDIMLARQLYQVLERYKVGVTAWMQEGRATQGAVAEVRTPTQAIPALNVEVRTLLQIIFITM
jgi:hypothetical protein